jgi:hypothetical protein
MPTKNNTVRWVLELYNEGLSVLQIAKRLSLTIEEVSNIISVYSKH